MSAVSKEDVAKLHSYLIVPMVVNESLQAGAPVEQDTQYALHVMLSEIDPDSALLAIALSAYRIALDFTSQIPVAAALKLESNKIVEDYGPDWLANYHEHPLQGDRLYHLLQHVPEDLEALADLLQAVQSSIRDQSHPAFTLCALLSVQARAHMEIADYVLGELELEMAEDEGEALDDICAYRPPTLFAREEPGSNIILFPIHRRR